uniref:Uncharacterized protein n=1 Tax=Magallana gigas TaxID=29159 RepID=K1PA00_MAGGI
MEVSLNWNPNADPTESPALATTSALNLTNVTYKPDPGGSCQQCSMESSVEIAHCVAHYTSVTISCVFTIEVFDGLVVLMVCAMELLFTIFWDEVLCYDEAVEAATYLIVLRFCRIPRACSVRKRRYAERLENEMHYLRKAKSKSEEHSRELTTKLKRQQRELFELQNRLSSISMSFSNENISSQSISDQSTPQISNGTLPNGFHTTHLDEVDSMTSSNTISKQTDNTETKENDSKELASRQSSVQYSSLLNEINSKREQIHNKSLKQKSGSSRNTSPKKEAEHPEVIYSNAHETTYMNTTGMYDGGGGSPLDSRAADIVFQLDKIIRDNQSNGVATAFRDSAQSAHSVETDDDEAQLIRRSYGKSNNHVRASFAGRENKAFSIGEKTRASFTARDSRAHFSTRQDFNEEVRMRNLEVMAEYEGTRTYRSAEGIPLTDL